MALDSLRPVALDSLRGDREFRKVRQHGVPLRDPLFTLRITEYRPRHGEVWRPRSIIGIVVPKKTLKLAVQRNRARRRVREALRTLPGGLPPCRAILMPNPAVLDVPFPELQAALRRALDRAPGRIKTAKAGAGAGARGNQARRGGGGRGGSGQASADGGNPRAAASVPAPMDSRELSVEISGVPRTDQEKA